MAVDKQSQDENEKPAKVWQINALSDKIDMSLRSQDELKSLILAQSQTYPTKTELDLQLEKRDNRIKSLEKTLANYGKVVWTMGSAFVPIVALTIWQLIINSAKGSGQ